MIARALSALGLMKRSERPDVPMQARAAETLEQHIMDVNIAKSDAEWWAKRHIEALRAERDGFKANFKLAATDLAKQAEEIAALKAELVHTDDSNRRYASEIDALRPDALLWRAARDKRAARKGAVS